MKSFDNSNAKLLDKNGEISEEELIPELPRVGVRAAKSGVLSAFAESPPHFS